METLYPLYQIILNPNGTRSELPSTGLGFSIGINGSTILGARDSSFTGTQWGYLPYGFQGTVQTTAGRNNAIIGGACNFIEGRNICSNTIIGGCSNVITSGIANVVGGVGNCVLLSPRQTSSFVDGANVVFGYANRLIGRTSTILGGCGNVLANTGEGVNYNSILGGQYNCTYAPNPWDQSSFFGLDNNPNLKYCQYFNGPSFTNTIVGGLQNRIGGQYSVVHGGLNNRLIASESTILGGNGNCSNADCSIILGGRNNLLGGRYSLIGPGQCNRIGYNENNDFINGDHEIILGNLTKRELSSYNSILNGFKNIVRGGTFNSIVNGVCNFVSGSSNSILGGSFNYVEGGNQNYIGNGSGNLMHGLRNSILQGANNSLGKVPWATYEDTCYSSILNGCDNYNFGNCHSIILNGRGNIINPGANGSFVMGNNLRVLTNHSGVGILSDASNNEGYLNSIAPNTLLLKFRNGVHINSQSGIFINNEPANFAEEIRLIRSTSNRITGLFV